MVSDDDSSSLWLLQNMCGLVIGQLGIMVWDGGGDGYTILVDVHDEVKYGLVLMVV